MRLSHPNERHFALRRPATVLMACGGVPAGLSVLFMAGVTLGLTASATPASAMATATATATTFYAYANGRAVLPSSCPPTADTSKQCNLGEALTLVNRGGTVALATPGRTAHYVGNWTLRAALAKSPVPVEVQPAPGVARPVLDGNHGQGTGCTTTACNGPILTIYSGARVNMDYITFQDADNTATNYGGAIENAGGGVLDISGCTFLDDVARNGGAIDNGDNHGGGTLDVSGSRFSRDSAIGTKGGTGDGGAIDNGDNGGTGKLTVSSSTFSGNSAIAAKGGTGDGGAIDNSDNGGTGTLTALSCTFSRNTATGDLAATDGGGAIDNADNGGTGTFSVSGSTLTANAAKYGGAIADVTGTGRVSGSTFSANTAAYGGAIDNGRRVSGFASTSISGSTFVANSATGNGGAIDNGDSLNVSGNLVVAASTFTGNTATGRVSSTELLVFDKNGDGGAIDNGDNEGTGTLVVTASTFSGNSAQRAGGALDNFTTLWASGDILNGACGESTGGLWNDEGYNIGSTTCVRTAVGDVRQGAGELGPLGDNGGPTETMLPLAGNPAVGAIPYNTTLVLNGRSVTMCPATDQRGVRSSAGQHCDAGAVQ
ncbi:MAG: choice-of-anchor Q domain-containing protein [Acidimicrobiales bacterium]